MSSGPSQFAKLLRQSKFTSYDPSIYQVYTSHGGHIARGDFGFKRPFPRLARKRNPNLFVSSIDTPEYQTEWRDAEDEVRRVERIEEFGAPMTMPESRWTEKVYGYPNGWAVDSDFDPSPRIEGGTTRRGVKPLLPMSEKEYQCFLDEARTYREEFRASLQKRRDLAKLRKWEAKQNIMHDIHFQYAPQVLERSVPDEPPPPSEPVDLFRETRVDNHAGPIKNFLGEKAHKKHSTYGATGAIVPNPHPTAGLNYHHPSLMQSILTYPTLPGHVLYASNKQVPYLIDPADDKMRNVSGVPPKRHGGNTRFVATIGGFTLHLPVSQVLTGSGDVSENGNRIKPTELFLNRDLPLEERDLASKIGRGSFKFTSIQLCGVPSMVREPDEPAHSIPEKLSVPIKGEVRSWKEQWRNLEDPYIPGTSRYISTPPSPNLQNNKKGKQVKESIKSRTWAWQDGGLKDHSRTKPGRSEAKNALLNNLGLVAGNIKRR